MGECRNVASAAASSTLAEDLLLLLFQPNSGGRAGGTIAGENTLFYPLAGAVLADVRDVLLDGAEPRPRVAALVALLSASGALPQFDPEIPWTSPVITRAKEFDRGSWGAGAAGDAVTRTVASTIVSSVVTASAAQPRS